MSERGEGERREGRGGEGWGSARPLLPGIHALLVWMSQLTSSDNCEPRALSKAAAVIVLIGSPLLCLGWWWVFFLKGGGGVDSRGRVAEGSRLSKCDCSACV